MLVNTQKTGQILEELLGGRASLPPGTTHMLTKTIPQWSCAFYRTEVRQASIFPSVGHIRSLLLSPFLTLQRIFQIDSLGTKILNIQSLLTGLKIVNSLVFGSSSWKVNVSSENSSICFQILNPSLTAKIYSKKKTQPIRNLYFKDIKDTCGEPHIL